VVVRSSVQDLSARARRAGSALARLCLVFLAAAWWGGCRRGEPGKAAPAAPGVSEEATSGPLTVRITLDHKEITLADRLLLTVTAECDEGYDVVLPKFGENLEQFLIRDARTEEPRLVGPGRVQTARVYTLEPLVSGAYPLRPMKVTFGKHGEETPGAHELETPEVTVTVTSLLPEDIAKLDVEDIVGPQELPRSPLHRVWWALAAVLPLAALGTWLWRRYGRRARELPPPRPAHEIAYEEMRGLVARDLPGQGLVKEFYQELSGILRRYIENRFQLHAPERTTEEFLDELRRDATLAPPHKQLLEVFLTHCDLVKFAEVVPSPEQIQETFDRCKAFIEQTRADLAPAAGGGPT
jgi:hypothetical protein